MIWTTAIALLGLMALSIPVGIVLFLLGIGVGQFYSAFPLLRGMGQVIWSSSNSSTLIAIPLFVLLGEILVRGGVAERTYAALDKWLSWLPGGLVHANIATATMFSATSGSSPLRHSSGDEWATPPLSGDSLYVASASRALIITARRFENSRHGQSATLAPYGSAGGSVSFGAALP